MLKTKAAAPVTVGILILAATCTTSTFAHYANEWIASYLIGVIFAIFGVFATVLMID